MERPRLTCDAPKGIAALYVRQGVALEPLVYGGGQEHGLRAGTENVAFAVALGTAAELAAAELADGTPGRIAGLRDGLHRRLADALPGRVHLSGPRTGRLPNTLNVSIDGVLGHELLAAAPDLHRIGLPQRHPHPLARPDSHGSHPGRRARGPAAVPGPVGHTRAH
ncbi:MULTISPECIES: aminotransferase class V-fold PLP-dependent enzyme [Streptomyces]|uniref:Aminotransferase class V-fold PLP-dependent enzyme n=2 Tax=Streptomyces TaxID=1883 RepID=A0ABV9J5A6_9ACTN